MIAATARGPDGFRCPSPDEPSVASHAKGRADGLCLSFEHSLLEDKIVKSNLEKIKTWWDDERWRPTTNNDKHFELPGDVSVHIHGIQDGSWEGYLEGAPRHMRQQDRLIDLVDGLRVIYLQQIRDGIKHLPKKRSPLIMEYRCVAEKIEAMGERPPMTRLEQALVAASIMAMKWDECARKEAVARKMQERLRELHRFDDIDDVDSILRQVDCTVDRSEIYPYYEDWTGYMEWVTECASMLDETRCFMAISSTEAPGPMPYFRFDPDMREDSYIEVGFLAEDHALNDDPWAREYEHNPDTYPIDWVTYRQLLNHWRQKI